MLAARMNGGGDGNHDGVWCPLERLSDHALPTVMNAVLHALAPQGVRELDMPATSARVWQAMQQAKSS